MALHGVAETIIFVVPTPPGALHNIIFVDPAPPGALQTIIMIIVDPANILVNPATPANPGFG